VQPAPLLRFWEIDAPNGRGLPCDTTRPLGGWQPATVAAQVIAMTPFEQAIEKLKIQVADLDPRLMIVAPGGAGLEPPLFVNVGFPPCTEEELERLLAQDAG
jgi:hypothetical protein